MSVSSNCFHFFEEDSGDESQDSTGVIPTHLPKRQRELFLRIQQQQRRAEDNQENKVEESEEEAAAAEDDWYSSDEDGPTSLTDVLKNLKDGKVHFTLCLELLLLHIIYFLLFIYFLSCPF